jgi:zinc protease
MERVYRGTRYAHVDGGTVASLKALTLGDVKAFHAANWTRKSIVVGVGGGYAAGLPDAISAAIAAKVGPGTARTKVTIAPEAIRGRSVVLVDNPSASGTSISFGAPVSVRRGDRDFYALWIANSWLGEHRNQASHLFSVIREARGLNYGDYSYIEAFPDGGERTMPPVNVPRRHQLFEVWVRTLPNSDAPFALRAALHELTLLVEGGLSQEQFELTRTFLKKYSLHFAETASARLGYAMDDKFYGIDGEGHLARFRRMMDELTVEDVNAAIRRHWQHRNLKIAIVTGDAPGLAAALSSGTPTPVTYDTPKPSAILEEDRTIAAWPLDIAPERIEIVPVAEAFER